MKEYFVYIARCIDESYYTGICNNMERRLQEHQEGHDPKAYTFKRRPVTLVYQYKFNNVLDAINAEKQIKGWSRKKKEALINNNVDLLHELSRNTKRKKQIEQIESQLREHASSSCFDSSGTAGLAQHSAQHDKGMHLIPLKTPRIEKGDDLVSILVKAIEETCSGKPRLSAAERDILVISSKAVATSEGNIIDLTKLSPSDEAIAYAKKCGRSERFCQAVLEETSRSHGRVVGICSGAMLTELAPIGLTDGVILTANAGLDESNTKKNTAVGWPKDPVASAKRIRKAFLRNAVSSFECTQDDTDSLAVIISDSCCRPRRWGVTAFALACAGIHPLSDQAGTKDLYGKTLYITKEAVADQLATAANMLMGNADQSIPAVIIRDHGLTLSDYCGWVPGIPPEEDLFRGIL